MRKIISFLLLGLLAVALVACGETTDATTTTSSSDSSDTTASVNHDPVTITYAAWNLGTVDSVNLERLMIEAFMVEYPWITVEIVERPKVPDSTGTSEIDQNWNEFLGARAAQGTLPDVYFTDSTETTIMNNWAKDVTDIAHADPEFMAVSEDIREAANYGGHLMALPYAVYYFGYYINKTIFENANADYPTFEDSFNEFLSKVGDVANQTVTNGTGTAGIVGIDRMLEWYPAQLNQDLGWYTYDGSILHLDGAEFETTLNLYQSLMQDKTLIYDALTPEEQLAAFGTTNAWASSQLAAYWEYTPIIGSMLNYDFEVDFIGTPGTAAAHQIPVVLDLMCISSQTQHVNEAYLLAKWMSFGKDGYLKRIAISTDADYIAAGGNALNMTPLQPDTDLLDAFFGIYTSFTELRKVVSYNDYIIEPNKYVPGYIKARWNADYDAQTTVGQLFDQVRGGKVNYSDVKTQWNDIANNALTVARTSVLTKLGVTTE
ncbi:MAG: ABC transporter substrate-binding protein [Candidatus Izemoplasmatales bacterium]